MRLHSNLLLTLVSFSMALPALAAAKTKGLPDPAPAAPAEVDYKPVQDAKSKLAVAQGKVERAQDAMNQLLAQLRKEAEASPTVAEAAAALKQAQGDYDTATIPILTRARTTSQYVIALDAKKAAAAKVIELQAAVPQDQAEITKAAMVVLQKGHVLTQLEAAALTADPKAVDLKTKLAAANSRLLKARYEAEQAIKTNPQIAVAKKAIEEAQTEVAPLQSEYNSALARYNAAVAERDAAMAQNARNANNRSTDDYRPGGKMYKKKT